MTVQFASQSRVSARQPLSRRRSGCRSARILTDWNRRQRQRRRRCCRAGGRNIPAGWWRLLAGGRHFSRRHGATRRSVKARSALFHRRRGSSVKAAVRSTAFSLPTSTTDADAVTLVKRECYHVDGCVYVYVYIRVLRAPVRRSGGGYARAERRARRDLRARSLTPRGERTDRLATFFFFFYPLYPSVCFPTYSERPNASSFAHLRGRDAAVDWTIIR